MDKWLKRKIDFVGKLVEEFPDVQESYTVSLKQINLVVEKYQFPFPAWITVKDKKVSRGVFGIPDLDKYLAEPVTMAEVDRIDYENFIKELNNEA